MCVCYAFRNVMTESHSHITLLPRLWVEIEFKLHRDCRSFFSFGFSHSTSLEPRQLVIVGTSYFLVVIFLGLVDLVMSFLCP